MQNYNRFSRFKIKTKVDNECEGKSELQCLLFRAGQNYRELKFGIVLIAKTYGARTVLGWLGYQVEV